MRNRSKNDLKNNIKNDAFFMESNKLESELKSRESRESCESLEPLFFDTLKVPKVVIYLFKYSSSARFAFISSNA